VNTNDAPVIISKDNGTSYQDVLYSVQYIANDEDIGDVLSWNLTTNAGNWLHINSTTGILSGIPTNDEVGSYWVNVTVRDLAFAYDFSNFTLTVINVNDPPKITSIPETTAILHVEYEYQVTAVDIDIGDKLTFSLEVKPNGMTIDNTTGLIKWIPSHSQKGYNSVVVVCSDGAIAVFQSFNISVPNHKPVVSAIPDQNITVGDTFQYQVKANDSDFGDILNYSIDGKTAELSISSTGLITWVPIMGQVGEYKISVNISDGMDNIIVHFNISVRKSERGIRTTNLNPVESLILLAIIIAMVIMVIVYEMKRRLENSPLKKVNEGKRRIRGK